MKSLKLPYPDYTWSISQHMRRTVQDVRIMFTLLEGAAIFGDEKNYADKITAHVIEKGLVPPNVRGSRPQIWRDYQQVLIELGLIISTRYTDGVIVTPVGLMWLDGLIGNQELFTTQALRYQYPNAYKLSLPNAVRQQMQSGNIVQADTRTELDMKRGVLIKPAVLILRILLELHQKGLQPALSNRECALALMPTKLNKDWPQAFGHLLELKQKKDAPVVDVRTLRHIQEWYGLLAGTDIFKEQADSIILRPEALNNIKLLIQVCEYHEKPDTFWYPDPHATANSWVSSWFAYYGSPELDSQWTLPREQRTEDYIKQNYIEGAELTQEEEPFVKGLDKWAGLISLKPYGIKNEGEYSPGQIPSSATVQNIVEGFERRRKSTRLHDYIVKLVAQKLQKAGYKVEEDPQSVDILATNASAQSILEVKTVTPQTLIPRMRLGVGQLAEYRYRYHSQKGQRPTTLLVLSSATNFPSWLKDYFQKDIQLGLIGLAQNDQFVAHTNGVIEKILTH